VFRSFASGEGAAGAASTSTRLATTIPTAIPWNGANAEGAIVEGWFSPALTVNYIKGDVVLATAPPVLVDVSGPVLGFRSTPEYFSPDGDGVDDELFIYLTAEDASPIGQWSLEIRETQGTRQLFYRIEGRGAPSPRIVWDGRSNWGELVQGATDYAYTFSAADVLGNASSISGTITTDVLIIRDGDILRIQVPSITFRANAADFVGIPQDRLDANNWALGRVAQILNRFRDYRITVEGHANPVLRTAAEEANTLQPLSLARARFVMDRLVANGVSRNRLSPIGRGGTMPVANTQDQNNNWKNRRVEFLLVR
jgi:outer membrane protein OmpA-like peptidoglycan-associated protein